MSVDTGFGTVHRLQDADETRMMLVSEICTSLKSLCPRAVARMHQHASRECVLSLFLFVYTLDEAHAMCN
jgi:hypothetical protein